MSLLARAWIGAARARRRARRALRPGPPREALVSAYAPGRTWLDAGCMWGVEGALAFLAEASGAREVTGIDLMGATPGFEREHARRGSRVRFLQGDLHDLALLERAGPHDVVWCSGVLYHAPDPLLTLRRLRSVCRERLVLSTEALPELPGVRGACVLYPALGAADRAAYARAPGGRALGVTEPFDPAEGYGNWYWGITPSALRGMLRATGWEVERELREPLHVTVVARPARSAPPSSG